VAEPFTEKQCPSCGARLGADAVEGLCLKCLGRLGFSLVEPEAEAPELRRLGDYELIEEIARGGMGIVYRARQLSLNRVVAVKVLLHGPFSSPEFIRRFRNEAEAIAALRHPNLVAIYEIGEHAGTQFLAMEFIEGRSLAEWTREQPLAARRAAGYLEAVARAVQHAHERGVLHRDLKPSNILIDCFDQPRVMDFGLAKVSHAEAELTVPGQVLGSPGYIPPEQAAGRGAQVAAPADVYSLGAVLYHLVTGRPPFQGETLHEILRQVQESEPVPPRRLNPSVPLDLQTICLKCLQKDPARRYGTARELAEELARFLAGRPIQARPVSVFEIAWLWCRRRPALALMTLALHLALALGLAGILFEWRQARLHALGETEQRLRAEQNAAATRLNLYAADVGLAGQVVQQGDFGRARRTLDRLRPRPGESDLREFEWRYLWNLCRGDQLATLGEQEWIVTSLAYSSDGRLLASGGMGGFIQLWDAGTRQCLKNLQVSQGAVWSLAFVPGSAELIAGSSTGVQVWDAKTWTLQTNFPGTLARLSRDGNLLAVAESSPFYWQEAGPVALWDWRSGRRLRTLDQPGRTLALSPDARLLAVAGATSGFRLYETATGRLLVERATAKPVWSLEFSPDGAELASAGWSGEVTLWKTEGLSPRGTLSANSLNVWGAHFSPDGAQILTTSSDQTIHIWNRFTLQELAVLRGHDSEVWCAAFQPNGGELASGGKDQKVLLWSAQPPSRRGELPHRSGLAPLFSPDGGRLVTSQTTSGTGAELWDLGRSAVLDQNLAPGRCGIGFSADGRQVLALAPDQSALEYWTPGTAQPAQRVLLRESPAETNSLVFVGLSPEGTKLFGIDGFGSVYLWDLPGGGLKRKLAGPKPPIRNAALSARGRFLVLSIELESAGYLFDCESAQMRRLSGHTDFISGLAFSADGETLATGSMDGSIRLWASATGKSLAILPGHMEETTDVAFSPDGRTLASLGQRESLKLWHLPTLREVYSEPMPHAGHYLRFSPDGRYLAVTTDRGRMMVLEAPGGD
jgi:WD40 repeat protein/predicted Ser/Thr protein kinase